MKRILISGFLLFSLFIQAQEQNQFAYPLKNRPEKFDAYGDVTYYYMKDKVFNLREHALCKTDEIIDFKVNPSGSSYVVITKSKNQKKKVIIYDLWKSNKKLAELSKLSFDPQAVCYTGNARKLLLAGADGNVYFYDAITGKSGETITLQQAATALFASSNNYFMAAIHNASIEVWNMQNQSLRRTLKMSADVRQVDFSLDGQKMAVLTSDSKLTIYDTHTFEVFQAIDALGNAVYCSFHPEGKYIAVITGDSRILVLNLLNLKKREYVDSDESGINYVRFVKNNNRENIYLSYNTLSNIVFRNMNDLSPLHSKLIADKLQEKMDEWEKQMPGESLDEYRMRVNDLSRTEQIKLFEQEIATQMALDENGLAEMTTGAYNSETQMLSVELGGLPDIFLSVPEADVAAFMKPENLEFRNVKYGLNKEDEFELIYADVFNKANGKTYTYNNTEGQFLDYMTDEANYMPLKLVQQSMLEEGNLMGLKEDIVNQAKEENLISDHTKISVQTHIQPEIDANGNNIRNYQVSVAYTVDQEYSAREDYSGGKYKIEDSHAGIAMLKIVKQALEKDFAKYMVPGKRMRIKISGTADATPIRGSIKYDSCYGDFIKEPIHRMDVLSNITVTEASGITENDQLAFLRAVGVKNYLYREVQTLGQMQTEVDYDIAVSDKTGSEHRKVSVELTFEDAFDK